MNKEILYEILNSESEALSSVEIESIMNEELDKSAQDMDTDLIDLCLDALNKVDDEKPNKRKKKYRIGKILIAAVIFILVIGITIPVCAKYFNVNVPEGIVTIYREFFNIDISTKENVKDIAAIMEKDGIDNIVLPKILFDPLSNIDDYCYESNATSIVVEFAFSISETKGYVTVEKYNNYDFVIGNKKTTSDFENFEEFDVNGVSVLVFGNDDIAYISYIVDDTEYNISINCDYNYACKIAKTI